ncbi:MAG: restriction endonuclease subunit S [Gillisia sp.]
MIDTYSKYENSCVEWIGDIPVDWKSVRLKWIAKISKGKKPNTEYEEPSNGKLPYLSMEYLRGQTSSPSYADPEQESLLQVDEGDHLILWDGSNAGEIVTAKKGFLSSTMAKIDIQDDRFIDGYLNYLLQIAQSHIQANTIGMGIPHVSGTILKDVLMIIPTQLEQSKISQYLDHQTGLIDTIIEKKQQLIEKLKEQRQAIINEAVTKGLHPNAPMRDSHVKWLGKIPEHWKILKLKYLADVTRGAILRPVDDPNYFDDNGVWTYLNISDATKCDKYLYSGKLKLSELGSTKSARVEPGNLIMTASATIGKIFINQIPVCVHDGFIPIRKLKCNINFLYHYLRNPQLYVGIGKSNTQKNIYVDEVKNMFIALPPKDEQEEIYHYLEVQEVNYKNIMEKLENQLQKIINYRHSIISEAVTGKIDVREWEPRIKETA